MTKRKPKAVRMHTYYNMMTGITACEPDKYQKANATLYPDGAALPRDRGVERVVRAARAMAQNHPDDDAYWWNKYNELNGALAALGSKRK